MSILITGAGGMLGRTLAKVLDQSQTPYYPLPRSELDVCDERRCCRIVEQAHPHVIFHLAALTDLDYCEEHPDVAFRTNVEGTRNIARASQRINATLVFISSDGVFGGRKVTPYGEDDERDPVSIYGKTKVAAEDDVRSLWPKSYILRAGWFFGGFDQDKKFVAKILDRAHSNQPLRLVSDTVGSPTYTTDFCHAALRIINGAPFGTYHVVNGGFCSRYAFGVEVMKIAGWDVPIESISSDEFRLPAPRPKFVALDTTKLSRYNLDQLRPWEHALCEYVPAYLASKGW